MLMGLMEIAFQAPDVGLLREPVVSRVVGADEVPAYTPTRIFDALLSESI